MEGRLDITYLGVRTENVRRFAPKRALVDTNQAAGWAGGLGSALRVSQYTTLRQGGWGDEDDVVIRVWGRLRRLQSAGSLFGGGLPRLAMSGGSCARARSKNKNELTTEGNLLLVLQQLQGGREGSDK